jgi:hypothetical protein
MVTRSAAAICSGVRTACTEPFYGRAARGLVATDPERFSGEFCTVAVQNSPEVGPPRTSTTLEELNALKARLAPGGWVGTRCALRRTRRESCATTSKNGRGGSRRCRGRNRLCCSHQQAWQSGAEAAGGSSGSPCCPAFRLSPVSHAGGSYVCSDYTREGACAQAKSITVCILANSSTLSPISSGRTLASGHSGDPLHSFAPMPNGASS